MEQGPASLVRGRRAALDAAWRDAYVQLSAADRDVGLAVEDLELLAIAAHLTGHDVEAVALMERAHDERLGEGPSGVPSAVRWAFWIGLLLMLAGSHARGSGWVARASRLLEESQVECPEQGLLLVPGGLRALAAGSPDEAAVLFRRVLDMGRRSEDGDVTAMGLLGQGQALIASGQVAQGVALLDEVMVSVTAGHVTPIMTGIVYCAVIIACREVFDLERAREWTRALSSWCGEQQGLHPYRGQCLVHRSQILQLAGDWEAALVEVRRGREHIGRRPDDPVMGMARAQEGELLRLCGELADAEVAYREAAELGHPVQPGLALLRLAQGRTPDAVAAITRLLAETAEGEGPLRVVRRAPVLVAAADIRLEAGDVPGARAVADELLVVADELGSSYLRARAASADGAVLLAEGDVPAAGARLRQACRELRRLDAPHDAARAGELVGRACLAAGDEDTARIELAAAEATFERLGAAPDAARVAAVLRTLRPTPTRVPGGLTPREVEVLRVVATGATNREVAAALVISERTVARHLSNLFVKLDVTTRSAATSWAYEHGLGPTTSQEWAFLPRPPRVNWVVLPKRSARPRPRLRIGA